MPLPARLVALGGATEVTVWSNSFEVRRLDPRWRSVPYGRPIWNHQQRHHEGGYVACVGGMKRLKLSWGNSYCQRIWLNMRFI